MSAPNALNVPVTACPLMSTTNCSELFAGSTCHFAGWAQAAAAKRHGDEEAENACDIILIRPG